MTTKNLSEKKSAAARDAGNRSELNSFVRGICLDAGNCSPVGVDDVNAFTSSKLINFFSCCMDN